MKNRKANEDKALNLKRKSNILGSFFSLSEEDRTIERTSTLDFRDLESYTTFRSNEEEVGGKKEEHGGIRKEEMHNNGLNLNIFGMLNRNMKSLHSIIDSHSNIKKKEVGNSFEINNEYKWKEGCEESLGRGKMLVFESNYNWKEYNPEGNLDEILRKWGKMKSIYNNIQETKGHEDRYKHLKYYCFYVNSILQRFWAGKKQQMRYYSMISCKKINFNLQNTLRTPKQMGDQSPFKKRLAQIVGLNNLRNSSMRLPSSKLYDLIDEDQK